MTEQNVYLKQNVLVEPLFNRWYAWSYLIAPTTASMYVSNWHLKILRSFIANPKIHVSAQQNPQMIGGPFMDHPIERVDEVKELLEKTLQENEQLLEFAAAIKSMDEKLQTEADGHSLEAFNREVPEPLQGYIELTYDLHNHPSIRFIEGLLYKSLYYRSSAQSIALSLIHRDDRPFVLTTPRLNDPDFINMPIHFAHQGLDELFKMKRVAKPLDYIKEQLNVTKEDEELFCSFFTEDAPHCDKSYQGNDVRIRYYGHACILFETSKVSILIDPLVSYQYDDGGIPRYTFADLPEHIDYVLITHNHQDHFLLEVLLQLRHKIGTIIVPRNGGGGLADPSLKILLKSIGFKEVTELGEVEEIELKDGRLVGLPFYGEHSDLNIQTKLAYLINLKGHSMLCLADSNNLQPKLYDHLRELISGLDVFFIGMECDGAPLTWLYGPLLTTAMPRKMDQSRRLDGSHFERAIDIVDRLNPKQAYVYAMGQEPWLTHLTSISYTEISRPITESNKFVEECNRRGLQSERLFGKKEITLM
jgi:L-ascorbate metabolism protein UlaG (beta-lactamase superfamily)